MARIDFKGGHVSYSEKGKGSCLVLLHGFLEDRSIWKDYQSVLSNIYRVICIDLPGHGETSNFGYCHTMDFMAEAVLAVLQHLKIRKFHLVGHSMGGYVGMSIAENQTDKLKGLCLFNSTSSADNAQKKKDRNRVIKVVQSNKDLFISEAIPNLFNTEKKAHKRSINRVVKMAKKISVQGIIAALEGMKKRPDREIVLKFAPYPVLFIIGAKDNILPKEKLLLESNLNENTSRIILENTGHMGFLENPDECLKAIQKWLRIKLT